MRRRQMQKGLSVLKEMTSRGANGLSSSVSSQIFYFGIIQSQYITLYEKNWDMFLSLFFSDPSEHLLSGSSSYPLTEGSILCLWTTFILSVLTALKSKKLVSFLC